MLNIIIGLGTGLVIGTIAVIYVAVELCKRIIRLEKLEELHKDLIDILNQKINIRDEIITNRDETITNLEKQVELLDFRLAFYEGRIIIEPEDYIVIDDED